jgi:hypothetical protein
LAGVADLYKKNKMNEPTKAKRTTRTIKKNKLKTFKRIQAMKLILKLLEVAQCT